MLLYASYELYTNTIKETNTVNSIDSILAYRHTGY